MEPGTQSKIIYIAGPMRGYPRFNFDAFDAAEEDLSHKGWTPISPAQLDRQIGFNPDTSTLEHFDLTAAIRRDVEAILQAEAIALLPGWEKSKGARAELVLAQWAGREVFVYPSMTPLDSEDVLDEAARITKGDRQAQYGAPDQDFQRIAGIWSHMKGVKFEAREVAAFMIAVKLSRQTHQNKRDNWVDIAGYARCGSLCTPSA